MILCESEVTMPDRNDRGETFGQWLMAQKSAIGAPGARGALGDLVVAAMADPKFPRRGSPDDVRKRLNEMQATGDMHAALDEAETDWRNA